MFDYLTSRYPPNDGLTVVDVGAGTGIFTRGLLQRGYRTIAVEASNEMREVAERDLVSNHRFASLAGTAVSFPVDSQSIDLVSASAGISLVQCGERMRRVLASLAAR